MYESELSSWYFTRKYYAFIITLGYIKLFRYNIGANERMEVWCSRFFPAPSPPVILQFGFQGLDPLMSSLDFDGNNFWNASVKLAKIKLIVLKMKDAAFLHTLFTFCMLFTVQQNNPRLDNFSYIWIGWIIVNKEAEIKCANTNIII